MQFSKTFLSFGLNRTTDIDKTNQSYALMQYLLEVNVSIEEVQTLKAAGENSQSTCELAGKVFYSSSSTALRELSQECLQPSTKLSCRTQPARGRTEPLRLLVNRRGEGERRYIFSLRRGVGWTSPIPRERERSSCCLSNVEGDLGSTILDKISAVCAPLQGRPADTVSRRQSPPPPAGAHFVVAENYILRELLVLVKYLV